MADHQHLVQSVTPARAVEASTAPESDAEPQSSAFAVPGVALAAGPDPLGGSAVPAEVETVLRRRRGAGQPLPVDAADRFGSQLRTDLSDVRVHADGEADRLTGCVQAEAFTHGSDIYFSRGSYAPKSSSGEHLLAHELAHVAQGRREGAGASVIGRADDPAEAAADRTADRLVALRRQAARTGEMAREPRSPATAAPILRKTKVRKPKGRANVIPGKTKDELEKHARSGTGRPFRELAEKVYSAQPDQFVALLAYKLNKHAAGVGTKLNIWRDYSPEAAVALALDKNDSLNGADDADQVEQITKAAGSGDKKALASFYRLHPDLVEQVVADKLAEGKPTTGWTRALAPEAMAHVAEKMGAETFIDKVLIPMRGEAGGLELMQMHPLTEYLEKHAGKKFDTFRDSVPMLRVVKKGREDAEKADVSGPLDIVDKVFDAFVRNEGIDLSYYTNSLEPTLMILTGGTAQDDEMFKAQRELLNKPGGMGAPSKPATQCHNLLKTLENVMLAVPGLKLNIVSEDVAGVTLTRALKDLPQGLIDKSFKGNVFDEAGRPTGQVCFTGNEGTQSHTWSVINGKAYDPVMGTKGDEVKGAVDGEFEPAPGRKGVFREKGGVRFLVAEKGLRATANSHGFGSGYRLTTKPESYEV
jgi:uncharacterized protein DUF4157